MNVEPVNPSPESQSLWYYADAANQPVGPLPFSDLQQLAAVGVIQPETHVIEEGGTEWKKFASVVLPLARAVTKPASADIPLSSATVPANENATGGFKHHGQEAEEFFHKCGRDLKAFAVVVAGKCKRYWKKAVELFDAYKCGLKAQADKRAERNLIPADIAPLVTATPVAPVATMPPDPFGVILMLLPLGSAVLMWFRISDMNLLQNPSSTLHFFIGCTLLATATLIAFEASKLGMGANVKGERTTGPVGWFLCVLLLWVVGYPAYLYSRSRFGFTNRILGGFVSAGVFIGVAYVLDSAIEVQKMNVLLHIDDSQEKLRELQRSFERVSR